MTNHQILNADKEKPPYLRDVKVLSESPWKKEGRYASKTFSCSYLRNTISLRMVVAFSSSLSHEVEESWITKLP